MQTTRSSKGDQCLTPGRQASRTCFAASSCHVLPCSPLLLLITFLSLYPCLSVHPCLQRTRIA
ncbi:hypothetical protein CGRA01v4_05142 [Colletotrichum graminicola]|nr:hypothetical protein CGRA01v4_05142 [Colletotrichum graminicola]